VVDVHTIEALLGVPPGYPPWRVADIARRKRILATWLSAMAAGGHPLPPAAAEHLARARRRTAELHEVGRRLAAEPGVTVIKGARIAAHLPPGLLRESGDVDLVAAGQAALWRCVALLRERHGAVPQTVSVLRAPGGGMHVGVALKWPAEEPYLDKPLGADVTTCAFAGDFRGVPVRAEPPADPDLCSLFAVAEERFQRPFRARDLLDLAVLAEVLATRLGEQLVDVVAGHAARLCLAPELRALTRKAAGWVELPAGWAELAEALAPIATAERASRHPDRPGMHSLRFGLPLDGPPLDGPPLDRQPLDRQPLDGQSRDGQPVARDTLTIREFDGGELALTPVGPCLLVASRTVPQELYEKAVTAAGPLLPPNSTTPGCTGR